MNMNLNMYMTTNKIIFTGPVGAGKTTAISTISDVEPFCTEQFATDETKERKELTTVAMDYGMLKLQSGELIHLYGTPGQSRFDFMWEILTEGGIGVVILIDNSRPNPLEDFAFFVNSFRSFIRDTAAVVGITRSDIAHRPGIDDYWRITSELDLNVPIFEVDARDRNDVVCLVQALLYSLDAGIEE